MGELILRNNTQQEWVSIIFFLNLLIVSSIFFLNPNRVKRMIKFYATDFYISKYTSERNLNYLSVYNLLSFLLILNTLCLFIFSFFNYSSKVAKFDTRYYYLIIVLFIYFGIRFLLLKILAGLIGEIMELKSLFFKSFTHHVQFSLILFIVLFLNFYSSLPNITFIWVTSFIGLMWFFYQSRVIVSVFRSKPRELIYIILYLCTLKIIPWYWLYFFVIGFKL
tara:strand:- start:849 stop:1514 length:666 start_codon:yes stop_codon:yes gene_type:complete